MGYFERELSKRFKKVTFIFLSNRMTSVYVTRIYLYSIRMSLVCTRVSFVYHSYVIVCYPYVTRMWFCHESDICPNLFKNVNFLTRPLRRKCFQEEINSTEAYSVPSQTPKIIFTKTIDT